MFLVTHRNKIMVLLCCIVFHSSSASGEGQVVEDLDGKEDLDDKDLAQEGEIGVVNVMVSVENSTESVDRSAEEWVRDAVLDVAYYLRAHKFNDFDRRYYKDSGVEDSFQYQQFPNPPLRYLHWEVYKYCDIGFYDCLAYLQNTVLKAELVRSLDTNVVMNERHWEYPRNAKSIDKLDKECVRLKAVDWRDADPFKGPLERFQWRVSASYYMCFFSMQDLSPLTMFGERCDNFASCLDGKNPMNGDPRADDSKPYQCALYSFCPDICCPLKKIQDMDECLDYEKNPCFWQTKRSKRQCTFKREQNQDLAGMALNQWNVTCQCEPGYVWESMFGSCVDLDECAMGTHNCTAVIQNCLNLQGRYACTCAWGYMNVTGTCIPNDVLTNGLAALHQHYHPAPALPPRPFSFFNVLFNWTSGLFHRTRSDSSTELPLLRLNDSREQIIVSPES